MKSKPPMGYDELHRVLKHTAGSAAEILHLMDREGGGPGRSVDFFDRLFDSIRNAKTYGELAVNADRIAEAVIESRHRLLKATPDLQEIGEGFFKHGLEAVPRDAEAARFYGYNFAVDAAFANRCFFILEMAYCLLDIAAGEEAKRRILAGGDKRIDDVLKKIEHTSNELKEVPKKITDGTLKMFRMRVRTKAKKQGTIGAPGKADKPRWNLALDRFEVFKKSGMTDAEADAEILATTLKGKGIKPGTVKRRYHRVLKKKYRPKMT